MEGIMAEVVANTGVTKEAGYFYYLGKDGNVWRTKMAVSYTHLTLPTICSV